MQLSSVSQPLISVIMPAYNRQDTIAYSIESVLNQTYHNFELILIDDASTDATHDVMDFYRRHDPRIKISRNEFNSRSAPIEWEPRNDGLKLACGELICYLDSDNLWHPDFLKTCQAPFKNSNVHLVHCNSKNHYRDIEQYKNVLALDKRALISASDDDLTTVYSYKETADDEAGLAWYIDTNEMMHRAAAFKDLTSLWATRHPNRAKINGSQIVRCTYRRHNDQELAERIIAHYGIASLVKYDEALVDFFYAPRQHNFLKLRYQKEISAISLREGSVIPKELNIDFFYNSHLKKEIRPREVFDLGVGEIVGPFNALAEEALSKYVLQPQIFSRFSRYGGTASLGPHLKTIAARLAERGLKGVDESSITPCDGGHNALFHSLQALHFSRFGKSSGKVLFMVPAYPYWSICTAANLQYEAIEAYSFDQYLETLESFEGPVTAIIINTPNNPLGIILTGAQAQRLNRIAKGKDCAIVADIPYHEFMQGEAPLQVINELDDQRTIFCDSASKSMALPGLRLGFALARNADLSALVRSCKSASSLLPSSMKLDFIMFIHAHAPDYQDNIKAYVRDQINISEKYIQHHGLPLGVWTPIEDNATIYRYFHISEEAGLDYLPSAKLAEILYEDYGLLVSSSEKFFPPGFDSAMNTGHAIRLSFGKIQDVEGALGEFFGALADLSNINSTQNKL